MMFPLLLLGCIGSLPESESRCEIRTRPITSAELVGPGPGFSVAQALEAYPQRIQAQDLRGSSVSIEISIGAGDGTATLYVATVFEGAEPQNDTSSVDEWSGDDPLCTDALQAPVTLTLAGDEVSFGGAATLLANAPAEFQDQRFEVTAALDLDLDRVPFGVHGPAASGHVTATYEETRVIHLEATVITEDGARETVLWFDNP